VSDRLPEDFKKSTAWKPCEVMIEMLYKKWCPADSANSFSAKTYSAKNRFGESLFGERRFGEIMKMLFTCDS
jgi:hypothetical protein